MKFIRYNQFNPNFTNTFGGLLDRLTEKPVENSLPKFKPAVDISEEENQFEIQLSVPGIKKEDFKIEFLDGKLTISGERKSEDKKEGKNFHRIESHYGTFSRSFFLPDNIKEDQIAAVYEDGVLKVSIPKEEKKVLKSTISVK